MEYKSVSTKLSRVEFTRLEDYCKKKGTKPSPLIRELVLNEIETPMPHNVAGKNKIVYNKEKDNFSWFVELDNNEKIEIMKNISPSFLEDLKQIINGELKVRDDSIGKKKDDSVSVPSKLLGGKRK